ncbi:MAG: AMP-binding protein, partial [Oscillospiraceae bacterium]
MNKYTKNDFYKRFCTEEFDENGVLSKFTPKVEENYNFAFDVISELAKDEPEKRALMWCNENGEERTFTFSQLDKQSNKVANMFKANGINKGDHVMLVLRRNYQFWFSVLALNKIGAIAIPATDQLMKKDYVYRFQAASITAVICTSFGQSKEHIEQAQKEYDGLKCKFLVGDCSQNYNGWIDFNHQAEKYNDTIERYDTHWSDPMLLYFTSGTTGYPKMVRHDNTYSIGHIITAKEWQCVDPDGIHLTISDTGWGKAAWGKLYGQWIMRTTVFVYDFDRFNAANMLEMMSKNKITSFCAPPTMFRFFI